MNLDNLQGIYKLENLENNNVYIGQSSNIIKRKSWHKKDLINGSHHQQHLQNEFNKRVELEKELNKDNKYSNYIDYESYVFDIVYSIEPLQLVDDYNKDSILDLEDKYILKYRAIQKGYKQLTNKEIKNKQEVREIQNSKFDFTSISDNLKISFKNNNKILTLNGEKINRGKQWDKEYMIIFYKFLKYIQLHLGNNKNICNFDLNIEMAKSFSQDINYYYLDKKISVCNRVLPLQKKNLIILLDKCNNSIKYNKNSFKKLNRFDMTVDYDKLNIDMFNYYSDIIELSKLFPPHIIPEDVCGIMEVK